MEDRPPQSSTASRDPAASGDPATTGDTAGARRNGTTTPATTPGVSAAESPRAESPTGSGGASSPPAPGTFSMEDVRRIGRRLGPAGPLALISATLPALGGFALLGTLKVVGPWLQGHADMGILLYVAGFALASGLAVLPTYAQSVLGGWAFGFGMGTPAAICGLLGGAMIGYVVARRAAGERVVALIAEHPKWKAVYEALLRGGFWRTLAIVTLLRVPSSPFAITNLVLAATRVGIAPYLLGTLIGLTPRTAVAVYFAAHAATLDFGSGSARWFWIGGVVATIAAAGVIGYWANRVIVRVTGGPEAPPPRP